MSAACGGVHESRPDLRESSVSRERGAGTVVVLALAAVVVLLALAVGALGAAQRARGAAQAAADLGALAAATAWRQGADPCATATEAVRRNGGRVVACVPEDGGTVGVRATRAALGPEVVPWVGSLGDAAAHARAGPRPGPAPGPARQPGAEPPSRPGPSP
ncbi:Rv3654c family TadE-like protein [Isoptericola sp. NPDC019571]|uniref:Rv3654c family TadE-like protein n=1 Tax=Isoptericola sp. NPDC019571 TaxID=3364008 RepID=UPI00379F7025